MDWTTSENAADAAAAVPALTTNTPRRRSGNQSARRRRSATAPGQPIGGPSTFADFAATIRRELAPTGFIEEILIDLAAQAAWDIQAAGRPVARNRVATTRRAGRALFRALDALDRHRATRRPGWGRAEQSPDRAFLRSISDHESEALPTIEGRWRDRLAFEPEVSDISPVVKGTWVTADQIISRIVDGWSWADILRDHPELSEDDIRACLSYTVEAEG